MFKPPRHRKASTGVGAIDTGQLIAEHYRLAEHIGSGAMGIVWKAIDERLQRPVAVKQIITQPGLSEQERVNVRERAMREARNAARLQHPNAIVVFDIAEHAGDPCLVMEYMPAHSLSALLAERGTLPITDVARIGEQVAGALVAAHRAGIVHRDVKPGNVLLDETGTAKITDFGISRAAGDMTLTQTGLIGGTPAYLAPELARGADPSASSDVFALGATLYHAIEGQPPYGEGNNQLALLYAAASGKIVPPSQAGGATALLMSLLRAEPDERPSMGEARQRLAALGKVESDHSAVPAPYPAPPTAAPAGDGRPPWQRVQNAGAPAAAAQPDAAAANPTPPRAPTASFDSVRQETAEHGSAPPPQPPRVADSASGRNGKRKPVILGSAIAAVLAVAVVVSIILTGDDGGQAAKQGQSPAPPPSPTETTTPTPNTQSAPVEDWGAAGSLVVDFYDQTGEREGWNMLTPAVRQKYASFEAFSQYWDSVELDWWGDATAFKQQTNADGSLDIRLTLRTEQGETQQVVTVIKSGGELRIASDPRLSNPSG